MFLQEYDFEIVYRKGKDNTLCDYLSRNPNSDALLLYDSKIDENAFIDEYECKDMYPNEILILNASLIQFNDISKLQHEDKYFKHIIDILKGNSKNKNKSIRKAAYNYEIIDNKLYRVMVINDEFKNLLVVPKSLVPVVLQSVHDCILSGGHLGIRKTFDRAKNRFYWKTMFKDILEWIKSCPVCQKSKSYPKRSGKLIPIETGSRPFSKIGLDIIGMLPITKKGNRYILVAVCYLTKFAVTKAVKNITAIDVAKFLMYEIVLKYSAFDTLISDNGVQFRSQIIHELNNLLKSKHKFTTPYHPSTSGQVERCNQQLLQLIRSYLEKDLNEWDEILPFITHIYNVSLHSATKFNPFYLIHGYHAKLPIDFVFEANPNIEMSRDSYVYEIAIKLQKARQLAKENIKNSQIDYKRFYDKNKVNSEFNVGDKCLINYPLSEALHKNKLNQKWIGPFTVVHKVNNLVYEVESDDGKYYFDRIHISKMRPFYLRRNENEMRNEGKAESINVSENQLRRSQRKKTFPNYLKEYYLGK
ncbi:pol polyprotein-like protein [Dinothrombium tinctorium]|uniref:RNA-directed DNA polymerase n=1 Tax=Dinothrombium tinctorium TaxID=1965070 RepID=A0A3S3NXP6_9ACAR|nr:pol polyprotein-like protein [Dinothrombium tinctorium]RWS11194.1 pol polyprotein-like protein [Dinothrombium tinctorium]